MYQTIFSEIFKVLNLRENRYDFEMTINKDAYKGKCEVCGAAAPVHLMPHPEYKCRFCGFKKIFSEDGVYDNDDLCFAKDVNLFFKKKYNLMMSGETFGLNVPVRRFYKTPDALPGQVNFFKSKNKHFEGVC